MANLAKKIFQFLNTNLFGDEKTTESEHPFFGRMVYFEHKNKGGYWEAELGHPTLRKKFSVIIPVEKHGLDEKHIEFCRTHLEDLDGLFAVCRSAFEAEYKKWTKSPFPTNWREGFVLDGIEVPGNGENVGKWNVCYFSEDANHYFTAYFDNGKVIKVIVDG